MPRNGSGVYELPSNSFNPAQADTEIDEAAWNDTADDLATAITNSISTDGQTTTTEVIPFAEGLTATVAAIGGDTDDYVNQGKFAVIGATGECLSEMVQTAAGTNQKRWQWGANAAGTLILYSGKDDGSSWGEVIKFTRAAAGAGGANITSLTISPATTLSSTLTAAAANFSDTVTVTKAATNLFTVANSASTADARVRVQNTGGSADFGVDGTGAYVQANTFTSFRLIGAALRLANAYVATPQVTTGYVTIQDSAGVTYKVLVAT